MSAWLKLHLQRLIGASSFSLYFVNIGPFHAETSSCKLYGNGSTPPGRKKGLEGAAEGRDSGGGGRQQGHLTSHESTGAWRLALLCMQAASTQETEVLQMLP